MSKPLDVLLITPPSRVQVYQELSRDFAAIEPPVWSGLIATFLRQHSCSVAILDAEATTSRRRIGSPPLRRDSRSS